MSRRTLTAAVVVVSALAVPCVALGAVLTVASPLDPTALASCPGTPTLPCTVVSRTTAMQEVVGRVLRPLVVAAPGRVVGWQITLSSPTLSQIRYFDKTEGGPAEAQIAVIHRVKALDYRVVAVGPVVHLQPYFGQTASFPLTTTLPVVPGDVIALTVPTWAPALELRAGRRTAWRASRPKTGCTNVAADTAQETPGTVVQFACLYQTALVAYSAIEISTP